MSFNKAQSNPEPSTRIIVLGKDGAVKLSEEGLRKWFQSKSKDGKRGWVDVVDGDACAREKGETATPKCVSSSKRASMTPAERKAAQAAKRREDPNQPSKSGAAKPTYVRTDRKKMKEELTQEGMGLSVAQAIDKTKPPIGRPSVRRRVSTALKMREIMKSTEKNKKRKFSGKASISERTLTKGENTEKERLVKGMKKSYKDFKARYGEDAKSVMYATATKMAKEETEIDEATYPSDFRNPDGSKRAVAKKKYGRPQQHDQKTDKYGRRKTVDEGLAQARANVGAKKCWPGMKAKGTKMKNGKEVPNCVKAGYEPDGVELQEKEGKKDACYHKVKASAKVWPSAYASGRLVQCRKKGAANYGKSTKKESYVLKSFSSFLEEGAAWTKKAGKNSEGGLNEKGRKSYEAENPGSDLKAPSKKVGNPRRASFCARMKGMKAKLTSKKTASDPDSRINKSLRAWNC